jgi:rubrerythrin
MMNTTLQHEMIDGEFDDEDYDSGSQDYYYGGQGTPDHESELERKTSSQTKQIWTEKAKTNVEFYAEPPLPDKKVGKTDKTVRKSVKPSKTIKTQQKPNSQQSKEEQKKPRKTSQDRSKKKTSAQWIPKAELNKLSQKPEKKQMEYRQKYGGLGKKGSCIQCGHEHKGNCKETDRNYKSKKVSLVPASQMSGEISSSNVSSRSSSNSSNGYSTSEEEIEQSKKTEEPEDQNLDWLSKNILIRESHYRAHTAMLLLSYFLIEYRRGIVTLFAKLYALASKVFSHNGYRLMGKISPFILLASYLLSNFYPSVISKMKDVFKPFLGKLANYLTTRPVSEFIEKMDLGIRTYEELEPVKTESPMTVNSRNTVGLNKVNNFTRFKWIKNTDFHFLGYKITMARSIPSTVTKQFLDSSTDVVLSDDILSCLLIPQVMNPAIPLEQRMQKVDLKIRTMDDSSLNETALSENNDVIGNTRMVVQNILERNIASSNFYTAPRHHQLGTQRCVTSLGTGVLRCVWNWLALKAIIQLYTYGGSMMLENTLDQLESHYPSILKMSPSQLPTLETLSAQSTGILSGAGQRFLLILQGSAETLISIFRR